MDKPTNKQPTEIQYFSSSIEANVGFDSREMIFWAEWLRLEFIELTEVSQEREAAHAEALGSLRAPETVAGVEESMSLFFPR